MPLDHFDVWVKVQDSIGGVADVAYSLDKMNQAFTFTDLHQLILIVKMSNRLCWSKTVLSSL